MKVGSLGNLCKENIRLYKTWHAMLCRCNNPDHPQFDRYGGRGIQVDARWVSFRNFVDWANRSGFDGVRTLDRIDNDQGYSPENCRWADKKTQARNRCDNVLFEYEGERKTLPEWAELYDIKLVTLISRVKRMGWTMERALTERPNSKDKPITAFGRTQPLSIWAKETSQPKDRIYLRLKRGWSPESAISGERS